MANETLILGDNNWAVKTSNLLGYAVGESSGDYVPREFTFSRNSTATYTDENGVVQTADANIARVQDNSLLLEPQRTNLVLQSQTFGVSPWTKGAGVTVVDNNAQSPEELLNASTVTFTSGGASEFVRQSRAFASGTTYTLSVYARLVSGTASMSIDIENALTNSFLLTNVWQRYVWTITPAAAYTWFDIQMAGSAVIELYGAQVEAGAFATSYIPTTTTTVTRLADTISRSNIYSNGYISPSGGTLFVELKNNVSYIRDTFERLGVGDTTNLGANSLSIGIVGGGSRAVIFKGIGGVFTQLYVLPTDTIKFAVRWNGVTADIFANGVKVVSSTAFATTIMEYLARTNAGMPIFIQQMALFNTPLSDTELITMTTL